ncbi:hypothetical protein F442_15440 [Phytophthora nicotianae P10297]|uniref:Uncharacterized protein n=5 Tax=Phytophthora nicotianae TaxID=4792 RepID=W2YPU7_PHYNI|nr:hypothetical protein L915_15151 [Phytophthora nicotianae]ETL32361.1 hypothetical protein L916_15046 [Phytophthora nicotianae]ETP36663.1 hypothetical protein F442_15440 [Phytophthora nicotianae P10297]
MLQCFVRAGFVSDDTLEFADSGSEKDAHDRLSIQSTHKQGTEARHENMIGNRIMDMHCTVRFALRLARGY